MAVSCDDIGGGDSVDLVKEAADLIWQQQASFIEEQTRALVTKFAASKDWNKHKWSAAQFQAALDASPDVAGLASSPLTLFMVLTILPSISGGGGGGECKVELAAVCARVYLRVNDDGVWSRWTRPGRAACAWTRATWRWRRCTS